MTDLLYEKSDNIAKIIMNRPKKRNAINSNIMQGLKESFAKAKDDSEVKVVILKGAGDKAFTAGFDLVESMQHNITDVVDRRADTSSEIDFFINMWEFPKPIIAQVQGYCIGGGVTLSFLCDIIVASEDATFGNPEILLGYIPQFPIEIWKMPFNKVREFYYLSKYFTAKEMEKMGVVNFVVPFENLEQKALEVAQQVAKIPHESMRMMKHSINKCYELQGMRHTIDFAAEMFNLGRIHMQKTQVGDFKEGIIKDGLKSALNKVYT